MKQSISSYINNKTISKIHSGTSGVLSSSIASTVSIQYQIKGQKIINGLAEKVSEKANSLANKLQSDPRYTDMRDDGVKLAWEYEQADIKLGGRGSERWNLSERREIKHRGKLRGAEGHHGKNVSDHPEEQANPDNIKFYRSKKEHLRKGHNGNWDNESDMPLNNKESMLKRTMKNGILKRELTGIAAAAAIGFGLGFSIGAAISLAQNGISPETIRVAMAEGGNAGLHSLAYTLVGYTIHKVVSVILQGISKNLGIMITQKTNKIFGALTGFVSGSISILIFSVIEFCQLKKAGKTNVDAFLTVAKNAIISFSILCVSMLVMAMLGPTATGIIAIVYPVSYLTYTISKLIKDKKTLEKVRVYAIYYSKPTFI